MTLLPIIAIFALNFVKSEPVTFQNVTLWTSATDQIATITSKSLKEHLPEGFLPSLIVRGKIPVLHENSVNDIDNVGEIFFQENEIEEIKSGAFKNVNVKTLVINLSKLTRIDGDFDGLPVEQLQVSYNLISNITKLGRIPNLKRLILWHNRLSTVEETVFDGLVTLELLDLSENEISELPDEVFRKLPQLRMLILKKNKIEVVPKNALEHLPLTYLDLSGNFISILNDFLDTLPTLVTIRLSYNRLTYIPGGVFNNKSLQNVELNNNEIYNIDSTVFNNMPNLSNIVLSNNKLKYYDVDWFNNSRSIYRLFFSNNLIEKIPDEAFINMDGVISKWLRFDGNKIKKVSQKTFKGLKKVDCLVLANNEIEEWNEDFLSEVDKIYYLDLLRNRIGCPKGNFDGVFIADVTYLSRDRLSNECVSSIENWLESGKKVRVALN